MKAANDSIIDRMKKGESLASVPPQATWWPPRPVIKKNLSLLYPFSTVMPLPAGAQEETKDGEDS
jgi:hypothetical protein